MTIMLFLSTVLFMLLPITHIDDYDYNFPIQRELFCVLMDMDQTATFMQVFHHLHFHPHNHHHYHHLLSMVNVIIFIFILIIIIISIVICVTQRKMPQRSLVLDASVVTRNASGTSLNMESLHR